MIARRALLAGLPAVAAASVVPVALGAVRQPPAPAFDLQRWLDTAELQDVAQYHALKLAECLCKQNPGAWRFSLGNIDDAGFVLFVRDTGPTTFVGIRQDFQ